MSSSFCNLSPSCSKFFFIIYPKRQHKGQNKSRKKALDCTSFFSFFLYILFCHAVFPIVFFCLFLYMFLALIFYFPHYHLFILSLTVSFPFIIITIIIIIISIFYLVFKVDLFFDKN